MVGLFGLLKHMSWFGGQTSLFGIATPKVFFELYVLSYAQSALMILAALNIHHFVMESVTWRRDFY